VKVVCTSIGEPRVHSIEANSYGKEVTDGDCDNGGGEEHQRASGATRGGQEKQAGASGGTARQPTAVLLRGRGKVEEEEAGGAPGAEL
jgi:hypothetical protein